MTGGYRLERTGYFVHPTVLAGVSQDMRLFKRRSSAQSLPSRRSTMTTTSSPWRTTPPTAWLLRRGRGMSPTPTDWQSAWTRNSLAQLSDDVGSGHAVRGLQAVRLGLRERPRRPRGLSEEQDRLGATMRCVQTEQRQCLSQCKGLHQQSVPCQTCSSGRARFGAVEIVRTMASNRRGRRP